MTCSARSGSAPTQNYDEHWPDARPWLYGIARNVLREHWRRRPASGDPFGRASEDPWPEVHARLDAAARVLDLRQLLEDTTYQEA
jgi:DNA-directed RNA polymerase specialized sigma24 family protein